MNNFTYLDTMVFGVIGDVYICMHRPGVKPSASDWTAFVKDLEIKAKNYRVGLTYASNVGPSSLQRQELADMWERVGDVFPCVVLTDDLLVRGIITAINWFLSKPLRGMSTQEIDAACDYLMIRRGDRAPIRAFFETYAQTDTVAYSPGGLYKSK
jgi:hypothetical protein